jgi:hypothetical protein
MTKKCNEIYIRKVGPRVIQQISAHFKAFINYIHAYIKAAQTDWPNLSQYVAIWNEYSIKSLLA